MRDSETLQPLVVYRALCGEHGLWVCPAQMFAEVIERNDVRVRRPEYLRE